MANSSINILSGRSAWLLLWVAIILNGCGTGPSILEEQDGAPAGPRDLSSIPDAKPRLEPRSKYGNPASYVVNGRRYRTLVSSNDYRERGIASWYGTKFHGRRTSSGEPYDMYAMTAAHKSLPLPTYAQVTNLQNGRSVVVRVNDRGPFHDNRLIDLSYAAAGRLGMLGRGTGLVEVRALDPRRPETVTEQARGKSPPPIPATDPGLFIQVGAFGNRQYADRLQKRLESSLRREVRVLETNNKRQAVYRVRIGPLGSVESADALSVELAQLGIEDMHIVIE